MKKILLIIGICVLAFFACKKDIELSQETLPSIITGECTDITNSSAVLHGELKNKGSNSNPELGFYYSLEQSFSCMYYVKTGENFTITITDLNEGTTYYVRAFARNKVGEVQGKTVSFTTLSKKLPTMGSASVTNVTTNSATLSSNVASIGTAKMIERGFCISTTGTPTIADSCIAIGSGTGSFNYTLTGLEEGVTLYVRAYATCEVGTAYSDAIKFTTASSPIVTTLSISDITINSATLNGKLESEGTSTVTEKGFCYSTTTKTPTLIDNNITVNDTKTGSFSYSLTNLAEGTTCNVCAYAINSFGIAYGNVVSFTTKNKYEGVIPASFSISATNKVFFSQGNLQYQASSDTWRFSEHQWDYVGNSVYGTVHENEVKFNNKFISKTYEGWIDLFGWGTSGWNSGAIAYQPYSISTNESDYYLDGDQSISATGWFANADWGVYNKISNGGNQAGLWRTLTGREWDYLINSRANASSKYGIATVNNVNGLVLLPDDWTLPADLTFTSGASGDFAQNTYSAEDWSEMESNGAVFLPAAGFRVGTAVNSYVFNNAGYYWSSTDNRLKFTSSKVYVYSNVHDYARYYGYSVRLVQDVK